VERSLAGWREIEYEVMRDAAGTCITICNMENLDPWGAHRRLHRGGAGADPHRPRAPATGAAPRSGSSASSASRRVQRPVCLAPDASDYHVIEVNPRVSRSSALASKATGYPIARLAAKIAAGRRLDEVPNAVTGKTCAAS